MSRYITLKLTLIEADALHHRAGAGDPACFEDLQVSDRKVNALADAGDRAIDKLGAALARLEH